MDERLAPAGSGIRRASPAAAAAAAASAGVILFALLPRVYVLASKRCKRL